MTASTELKDINLIEIKNRYRKPMEVTFSIPGDHSVLQKHKNSFQARYKPISYYLQKDEKTGKNYLISSEGNVLPVSKIPSECAFVILDGGDHLELIIGNRNHGLVSGEALEVAAAGDIHFCVTKAETDPFYFDLNDITEKMTDRSGGYHISNTDPLLQEKKSSAQAAMTACGLPVHKLESFTQTILKIAEVLHQQVEGNALELDTANSKPLTFRKTLSREALVKLADDKSFQTELALEAIKQSIT